MEHLSGVTEWQKKLFVFIKSGDICNTAFSSIKATSKEAK